MDNINLKNILNKSLKLIDDLNLNNEVDITVCFLKKCKSIFYFVVETKDLKRYYFSLNKNYDFLSKKINYCYYTSNYTKLENAILYFIELFKKDLAKH